MATALAEPPIPSGFELEEPPIPAGFEVEESTPPVPAGFELETAQGMGDLKAAEVSVSKEDERRAAVMNDLPSRGMGDVRTAEQTTPAPEPAKPDAFERFMGVPRERYEQLSEAGTKAFREEPLITLPKPDQHPADPNATGFRKVQEVGREAAAGATRAAIATAEALSTQENIALLATIGGAPKAIQTAASAGFAALMGKGAIEGVKTGIAADTLGEKAEAFTGAALSAAMAGMAGKHAAGRAPKGGEVAKGETPRVGTEDIVRQLDTSEATTTAIIEQGAKQAEAIITAPSAPSPEAIRSTPSTEAAPKGGAVREETGVPVAPVERSPSEQRLQAEVLKPEAQKTEAELLGQRMAANMQPREEVPVMPAPSERVAELTRKAEEISGESAVVSGKQEPIAPLAPKPDVAESGMPIGPGKMTAGELPEGTTTGLKRATVDTERLDRGAEPIPTPERLKRDEIVRNAEDAVDADPTLAPSIVQRVLGGDRRISHEDAAALLVERQRLKNERTAWEERKANGEDATMADEALGKIEEQMERLDQAQRAAGSEWSDIGRMYQNMIKEDFTLEAIERKARAAKQGPLTPEERTILKEQAAKIETQQKEVEQLRASKAEAEAKAAKTTALEATIADLQGKQRYGKQVFEIAHGIVNRWKSEADQARAEWNRAMGKVSANPVPTEAITYLAKIIRAKVGEFGLKKAEALTEIVAELGESARPLFDKAWDKMQHLIGLEKTTPAAKAAVRGGMRKKGEKSSTDISNRAAVEAGAGIDLRAKTAYDAVRAAINEGAIGEEAIGARALEILKPSYPELTLRQLDEKFTDYGNAKHASQERVNVILRKQRQLRQMQLKIQDLQEKGEAPRFGTIRDKPDADVRLRIKELQRAVEEFSKDIPDTPESIASREATQVRTKENAIERLDRQLQGIEQEIAKTPREQSQKVQDLQAKLDAMRELKRELDQGPQKTPEQKALESKLRAAEKTRDALDARLQGKPRDPKAPAPTSPALEKIQSEIAAMREQLREMEAPPKKSKADRQIEQLSKTKEKLDEVLSGKRPANAPKDWQPLTPEAADLKAEIQAMRELAAQMRRDAKPKTDPRAAKEAAEIKALEKQIDEYARKVREADFTTKGKAQGPPSSKRIADLRAIRDSRRTMYKAAVKAGKPVLTEAQRYNKMRLSQIDRALAVAEQRLAKSDFGPRTKKAMPAKDRTTLDAEAKLEALKSEVRKGEHEFKQANRSRLKKAADLAGELLQSARGIILGSDIGVLTRQGLFSWSRPVRAIKATAEAFKAAVSPASMARWEIEVRDRVIDGKAAAPIRKEAGLQMTDTLTHPEELVVTKLLSRIPDFKVGGKTIKLSTIGRTLERFQTTFINAVRADVFDAAIKQGMTTEELKLRANFINSATGRSNIKHVPKALSMIFTSPRYEASRWEMLTQPVRNIGALARSGVKGELNKAALANLQDLTVTAAGIYGLYKLAGTAGYTVNWNPTSSDFLKMRKGDEAWDVSAGLAPRLRDVMRIYVSSTHPDSRHNIGKQISSIGLRTINPALKAPYEQASISAQRRRGVEEPKSPFTGFQSDEEQEGWIALAPLIVQGVNKSLEDGPGQAVFTGAREFVGSSVNRYAEPVDEPFPPED